jgi:hypothetical protein
VGFLGKGIVNKMQEIYENQIMEKEDIYVNEKIEEYVEDDEISFEESAFMERYNKFDKNNF